MPHARLPNDRPDDLQDDRPNSARPAPLHRDEPNEQSEDQLLDELEQECADRHRGPDRRLSDQGAPDGLERRRGPGRRLSDFQRAAEEGDLTKEQFLFLMSIERFKTANGVIYPSWTDVLEVVRLLGYRKTMPSEIKLRGAEDWRESPIAPAGVRPPRWAERFGKKAA